MDACRRARRRRPLAWFVLSRLEPGLLLTGTTPWSGDTEAKV